MKRKTKIKLQKKFLATYNIIRKKWGEYMYGEHSSPNIHGSIAILEMLNDVIKAHLKHYMRLYPELCGYCDEGALWRDVTSLNALYSELKYVSDRWNCYHRILILRDAPKVYAKLIQD